MKTNTINKSLTGLHAKRFVKLLNNATDSYSNRGSYDKIGYAHAKAITALSRTKEEYFVSFLEDDRNIIKTVNTSHRNGLILTRGFLLWLCDILNKEIKEPLLSGYSTDRSQKQFLVMMCLDICSHLRECKTNILEFVVSKEDIELFNEFDGGYYSSSRGVPAEFIPILSARYNVQNFTKFAQTQYYEYMSDSYKTMTELDIRAHQMPHTILCSEINMVRNEKPNKLKEITL